MTTKLDFRKKFSTTLAINKIYDKILNNIDQGLYTCCIFLDLSKAFNVVDHNVLLQKLEKNYWIRGSALELIGSCNIGQYCILVSDP